jgi:benzodiazapine receptor
MSSTTNTQQSSTATVNRLQAVNYANVIAYVANAAVVFGSTLVGLPDNATLSEKYQTLVTPAGYAFAIWGPIFIAELVWTIGQLLPAYRASELVTKGVGYYFVAACLAQCVWTVTFGLEEIVISFIAMVSILIPLLVILRTTSSLPAGSIGLYWLLKFPFEIHCAWIMAATLVNVNVLLVSFNLDSSILTYVGWASLVVVLVVGLFFTMKRKWVVPSVLAWASIAIAVELSNPKESIVTLFSETTIQQTRIASAISGTSLLVAALAKVVYDFIKKPAGLDTNEDRYSSF